MFSFPARSLRFATSASKFRQPASPGRGPLPDANRSLVAGRMALLEQGAIPRDSSGRWLRYVWLPEGQMANERLLELGFGAPSADPQDTKYQQRLVDAAAKAWQACAASAGGPDVFPMLAVRSPEANIREGPGLDQGIKTLVKQGSASSCSAATLLTIGSRSVRPTSRRAGWRSA